MSQQIGIRFFSSGFPDKCISDKINHALIFFIFQLVKIVQNANPYRDFDFPCRVISVSGWCIFRILAGSGGNRGMSRPKILSVKIHFQKSNKHLVFI